MIVKINEIQPEHAQEYIKMDRCPNCLNDLEPGGPLGWGPCRVCHCCELQYIDKDVLDVEVSDGFN